jgi:hypothetical protein
LEPQVANEVLVNPRLKLAHPESGLALVTLLRDRGGGGLTGSRALERSGGRVGLSSHGGVRGSGSAGGSRSGVSSRVLVLERIEVLERHDGRRVGVCKNNYNSGISKLQLDELKAKEIKLFYVEWPVRLYLVGVVKERTA